MSSRAAEKILGRFSFVFCQFTQLGGIFLLLWSSSLIQLLFTAQKKNCSVFIHDLERLN